MRALVLPSDLGLWHRTRLVGLGLMLACLSDMAIAAAPPSFPRPLKAWMKEGLFVAPTDVRLIKPGMTKRQVRALLGTPHFNEGFFGVRTWDYILNFHDDVGPGYRSCQFQIQFDREMRVASATWNSNDCSDSLVQRAGYANPGVVNHATVRRERLSIGFEFGSAELTRAATALLRDFVKAHDGATRIDIVGHTDSAGSQRHNDALSLARADAVAQALSGLGVAPGYFQISGRGERDPVLRTEDNVREPANRRSDVVISY